MLASSAFHRHGSDSVVSSDWHSFELQRIPPLLEGDHWALTRTHTNSSTIAALQIQVAFASRTLEELPIAAVAGRSVHAPRPRSLKALPKKGQLAGEDHNVMLASTILERSLGSWQFDAFALAKATANRPLSALGMYLFSRLGLPEMFNLTWNKLSRFLKEVERGYDDSNPYHNRAHAASVLHAMHCLLEHGGLMKVLASASGGHQETGSSCHTGARSVQLQRMACFVAAVIHDYEHKGLSNDFLVKTGHTRAIRYNDRHVNEHHHVEAAFDVLLRPENNFLEDLPAHEFCKMRSLVIDLVLSTDMAQHFEILQSAREVFSASSSTMGGGVVKAATEPAWSRESHLLLQLAMKCADLGHLALDWELHLKWVQRLEEEVFRQGDKEKEAGLPFSFLADRSKPGISGSQVGFFENIVFPLFRLLAQMTPQAEPMLESVEGNCRRWKELEVPRAGSA